MYSAWYRGYSRGCPFMNGLSRIKESLPLSSACMISPCRHANCFPSKNRINSLVQVNLDMTDSIGPGKLVRHMQNMSYTYDKYLIMMHRTGTEHIVHHMQKSIVQWSVISKFTCNTHSIVDLHTRASLLQMEEYFISYSFQNIFIKVKIPPKKPIPSISERLFCEIYKVSTVFVCLNQTKKNYSDLNIKC